MMGSYIVEEEEEEEGERDLRNTQQNRFQPLPLVNSHLPKSDSESLS